MPDVISVPLRVRRVMKLDDGRLASVMSANWKLWTFGDA